MEYIDEGQFQLISKLVFIKSFNENLKMIRKNEMGFLSGLIDTYFSH